MPRVSALHIYPVKSCRGHSIATADADNWGFVGDRRYMVVSAIDGLFLTQRTHPRMALIETELTARGLTLASPNHASVTVSSMVSATENPQRSVTIWKDTVAAVDCGDEVAEWLSRFLGLPLRLVHTGANFHRSVSPKHARPGDEVSFADGAPMLVVSEASLAELNDRIVAQGGEPVPMNRFRPNIVLSGGTAFAEDTLTRFRLGDVVFRHVGLCARCPITTTDQFTAARGKEPLKTLATFRRDVADPTDVNFGVNLVNETKSGTVRVGDEVTHVGE